MPLASCACLHRFLYVFLTGCFLKRYSQDGFDVLNSVTCSKMFPPSHCLVFLLDQFCKEMLHSYNGSLFILLIIDKRFSWCRGGCFFPLSISTNLSKSSNATLVPRQDSGGCYVFPIIFSKSKFNFSLFYSSITNRVTQPI